MNQSSLSLFNELVHPWIGAADADDFIASYASFDPNHEASLIAAIQAEIIPHVMTFPPEKRLAICRAIEEIQMFPAEQLERIWESILPPFALPDTPSLLFRQLGAEVARV